MKLAFEEKREVMKPALVKLGVALALSFAGYLYSHLRLRGIGTKSPGRGKVRAVTRPGLKEIQFSLPSEKAETAVKSIDSVEIGFSPKDKTFEEGANLLLPKFQGTGQEEFEATGISTAKLEAEAYVQRNKPVYNTMEQEVINLHSMVRVLQERERYLEIQLLEYYGLKEQESAVRELQNRLKISTVEAKFFTLKIEALQADNRRLEAQVVDNSKMASELESARAKIKHLKRKIRIDAEQNRDQLSHLQQRIVALREEEHQVARKDADVQKKLQKLKEMEGEFVEIKKANSKLQLENSELAEKLEMTLICSLDAPEVKSLEEEAKGLQQANDELQNEIERLRTDRCADVEELVYLRWVNACLRYELRNYRPPPGKTVARDLSKTLSPKSEEKAKQLILEYANPVHDENNFRPMDFELEYCSSSQASTRTECSEMDDASLDSVSNNPTSGSKKSKFFSKLRKLVSGKHHNNHGNNRVSSVGNSNSSCGTVEKTALLSRTYLDDPIGTYTYESVSPFTTVDSGSKSFRDPRSSLTTGRKSVTWHNSSIPRSSMDITRLRKLSLQETRETAEDDERLQEAGSLYGYKRTLLQEKGAVELVHDDHGIDHAPATPEKMELMKYAKVLKGSRGKLKEPRRTSSYTSL